MAEENEFKIEVHNWTMTVHSEKGFSVDIGLRAEGSLIDQVLEMEFSSLNSKEMALQQILSEEVRTEMRKLWADEYLIALDRWAEEFTKRLIPSAKIMDRKDALEKA